jgi:hypothetical protein
VGFDMKPILFLTLALILNCGHILAESVDSTGESKTISLRSFEMEIPEGWKYETATLPNEQVVTQIFHPDKEGVFQIGLIISLPKAPTQSRMRLLTNVDSSVVLNWQKWGNFSGYHYEHAEQGKFYRQWWLTHHNRVLSVVYSSKTNDESLHSVVDEMVKSLTITAEF